MKKNYVKSIGLVLLGGILSTVILSFSPKYTSIVDTNETPNNEVPFETAQQEIAAYQMWLKYLPKYVKLDIIKDTKTGKKTGTLTYPDKVKISETELPLLMTYYDRLKKTNSDAHKISEDSIPFYAALNYSYYISREDIEEAFDSDHNASGINVYLAMRGLDEMRMDQLETHLYVVPTQKLNDTILEDQLIRKRESFYALDLTDPCPALCDKQSDLYKPTLKPLK